MRNINLYACVVLSWLLRGVNMQCSPLCPRGEKCHTPRESEDSIDICIVCEDGYNYMPLDNHTWRHCIPCMEIVNPDLEELVSKCNRFHDAVILCKTGYFRDRAKSVTERDICKKCSPCEFPERECQIYSDTVCCDPKKEANTTEAGLAVCKKKSVLCGQGQFLTSSGKCEPCPSGTSMPENNHTYKDCLQCKALSNDSVTHAVIIRPCSKTAPTLFGCEEDYFRDPTQESTQTEVPCTPCRSCSPRLLDCGMFHDAVCDVDDLRTSTDPVTSTQSTGSTENTEKGARGNSLLNDTSDNQDRNQSIHAENGETQFQKSVSCNVTIFATIFILIAISVFLLYMFFCKTRRTIIVVGACPLIVALLFCVVFHAGVIPVSDGFNAVFVGVTIAVAGLIFIIALHNLSWPERRQPNKVYDKEKSTSARESHELVNLRIDTLLEVNEDEDVIINN